MEKKAFIGHKLRRFRMEQGVNQSEMAEQLDISPSYLNLIEHNQRPVTVPLLLRLSQTFDVDLRNLADDEDANLVADLIEVFGDPIFQEQQIPERELKDLIAVSPSAAGAVRALYRAYSSIRDDAEALGHQPAQREKTSATRNATDAIEEVREYQERQSNYFEAIESAAESLRSELNVTPYNLAFALVDNLRSRHSVETKVMPATVLQNTLRQFKNHQQRLLLSEMLPVSGRTFQLGVQTAFLEQEELIDRTVEKAELKTADGPGILKSSLANYFAGALMMPYVEFRGAAQELKHDIELMQQRFMASLEQVCHRLTTLQRPNQRGIPFFFLRVDKAGNVSKRLIPSWQGDSAGKFKFARFGGTCPRWVLHDAFASPGRILTQISTMPDDTTFFTFARTLDPIGSWQYGGTAQFAVALGCEMKDAKNIIYSDGLDLKGKKPGVPVGVSCRVCERMDCSQRAYPPLHHRLRTEHGVRTVSRFQFEQ